MRAYDIFINSPYNNRFGPFTDSLISVDQRCSMSNFKSSQVVGLRDRVAIILTLISPPYAYLTESDPFWLVGSYDLEFTIEPTPVSG